MPPPLLKQPVKLALIQLATGPNKPANLTRARAKVLEAARAGARIVVLPECFNSPYGTQHFAAYAEPIPSCSSSLGPEGAGEGGDTDETEAESPTFHALRAMARDAGAYVVGGSMPERVVIGKGKGQTETLYNTSLTFAPTGALLGTHRKVHLFDIDIPGQITFRESDALSPGDRVTVVDLPEYGRLAVAICYDVRFPEMAAVAARRGGAFALVYPGAFNLTTGPLHWELLARARAVDEQVYVALCSPARDESEGEGVYHAWGHSLVVDPSARVMVEAGVGEEIVYAELRPERIEEVRRGIPVGTQRRFDVYPDVCVGAKVGGGVGKEGEEDA